MRGLADVENNMWSYEALGAADAAGIPATLIELRLNIRNQLGQPQVAQFPIAGLCRKLAEAIAEVM